ncbi:MAG: hypothetical protein GX626_03260 [Spirochaetales bacterium]|nr:hypothetical protein [Spirochaetales bacterium]
MQTNHRTFILISLLIAILVITGCNADASAGLFRQISESTTPVGIQYRQLLDKQASDLYFTTTQGIYATDGNTSTRIKANSKRSRNLAAYLDSSKNRVLFLINELESNTNSAIVRSVSTASPYIESANLSPTYSALTSVVTQNLYANGLFRIQGNDSINGKTFVLATYDDTTPASPVYTKVIDFSEVGDSLTGYSIDSVLQMTGKDANSLSSTDPIIVSFATDAGDYLHYYTNGTFKHSLVLNTRLANFTIINGKLYILTTDGKLYSAGAIPTAAGTTTLTNTNVLASSNKVYDPNAFMYGVRDAAGSINHIITKSKSLNDPLYVLSFSDSATTATAESIRYGYGEYLDSAEIVSTYEKSANNLLVATAENGMFEITIIPSSANSNSASNGTSSESEDYTL